MHETILIVDAHGILCRALVKAIGMETATPTVYVVHSHPFEDDPTPEALIAMEDVILNLPLPAMAQPFIVNELDLRDWKPYRTRILAAKPPRRPACRHEPRGPPGGSHRRLRAVLIWCGPFLKKVL